MIFFLFGTDHFRLTQKLTELKNSFIQKRDKAGLNIISLNGEDLEFDRWRQEIMTAPFLGEKKMIIVKNILSNKKILKPIVDFLKDREKQIDNIVCFFNCLDNEKFKALGNKKISLTDPLSKYLSRQEFVWEMNLLSGPALKNWLQNYFNERSAKIEPTALEKLIALVGNDLVALTTEATKLIAYKNEKTIAPADVDLLVQAKFNDNIFNLVDALGQKNQLLALRLTAGQIKNGNHPLMILTMIIRQFKILLQIKGGAASAQAIGVHPFVFGKAKNQSRNFSLEKLRAIYQQLVNLEGQLKSGFKNPELLFNLFVVKNC